MDINIKATNLDLTLPLKKCIEEKIGGLDRFLGKNSESEAFLEVARATYHHKKGNVFRADINLKSDRLNFRAEAESSDIRVAIDKVKDELQEEIKKIRGKQITWRRLKKE